ncbi:MAG: hypothetical protein QOJ68_3588 [Blastococcus sp.]|jgi:hypothetical protein|nr:hypothetical protein [Blastococcus sp.]
MTYGNGLTEGMLALTSASRRPADVVGDPAMEE